MVSKTERVKTSIYNIEQTIRFLIKDAETKFYTHKISKKDCYDLVNKLNDVKRSLVSLKFDNSFSNESLDEIRRICLSIMGQLEEGDYNILFNEIMRINNSMCKESKERDRVRIGEFKRKYNQLNTVCQNRLCKVEVTPEKKLAYREKGLDNVKFLLENYLNVKYNLKKIKFDTKDISDLSKTQIEDCDKIINSENIDEETKVLYSNIKSYIEKYSSAEVVTDSLREALGYCNEHEFEVLKQLIHKMMDKYKLIYLENTKKYALESMNNIKEESNLKR